MTYRARCAGRRLQREVREWRRYLRSAHLGYVPNSYTFVWQEPDSDRLKVSTGFPGGYFVGGHSAPVPVAGPTVDMPQLIIGIPCRVCGERRPTTPLPGGAARVEPCPEHPEDNPWMMPHSPPSS